ncbi:hypothetical protein DRV85_04115 [Rhodosalinus halophilus]|uniref:Hedgehog/Intein (Hint) domain-containing protein n=1 Tax=Rhodosalinus halophilus TaxID=2259333 RepID=A0A365UDF8_9RHOB|nr:Hint domain-containing protein [Rhodosalinus halophilus]RBI86624.1 hypothetical protein DRV85_04115 [Rhodosalinus halophilus]
MPDYTIYVLEEGNLSISGGGQLDGVTQGDGSHLVGRTITLDAPDWLAVALRDDDGSFADNDGSQRLDGDQTLNGTTYGDGTRVEAEYGLTLSDGTNTWDVVGFNVNDSDPAYATVEGLAFIGGPGGFPPLGVPLTVVSAQEGPDFLAEDYATPICYDAGTLIATPDGPRRAAAIRAGDAVLTADGGVRPVLWAGATEMPAGGAWAPVEIAAGRLGNARALRVSPQHRLLIRSWRAELMLGADEVLVAAAHLVDGRGIRRVPGGTVRYVHLLLPRHDLLLAEGLVAESFYPGPEALAALAPADRAAVLAALPDGPAAYGAPARPFLRRHEAALLRAG